MTDAYFSFLFRINFGSKTTMIEAANFIEEIINRDLEEGKVREIVTRFPPEPNGYLHIGHAKSLCINFGIAKKYGGKCNLRFDDTNPAKEDVEYVDAIQADIRYLGFHWNKLCYASDYFDKLYDYAVLLIRKGLAYVCDYNVEQIRQTRGTLTQAGTESPNRNRTVEENLKLFEEMKAGKYGSGEKVLRAKIDMASPNMNMRDPVLYRILHATHHRTGDKWCIYPMYDFTHPLSDAIEGITHSVCTMEFEDHRPLYDWMIEHCECKNQPRQIEFARLNLSNTIMSKRYLKKLVEERVVDGWDDPRMPTLSGLRRRGCQAESIIAFCDDIGVAKANSEVDIAQLEFHVRDTLNQTARRVMAVSDSIPVEIVNYKGQETLSVPANPKDEHSPCMETPISNRIYIERDDFQIDPDPKYFRLKPGGCVRLKGAFVIRCLSFETDESGKVVSLKCEKVDPDKDGLFDGKKVKGVIHFVDAVKNIPAVICRYDYLLNDGDGDFTERININSKHVFHGYASVDLKNAKKGDRFQFLRVGYFCVDAAKTELTFNEIVPLKSGY